MKTRFSIPMKVALALSFAACAKAELPSTGPNPASRNPGIQLNPTPQAIALSGNKYRNADGSMDYQAMRRIYGEPNAHVVMNPKARDVSKTSSVHSVINHENELLIPNSESWVGQVKVGDTLYCGVACGGEGFLRNVTGIREEGGNFVVTTTVGAITDVVQSGWIQGTQDIVMDLVDSPEGGTRYIERAHPREIQVGPSSIPIPNGGNLYSPNFTYQIPGGYGTVKLTGSLVLAVTYDMALSSISVFGHQVPTGLDSFDVTATLTPSLTLATDVTASHQFGPYNFTILPTTTFGPWPFTVGPVEVTSSLSVGITGEADANGTVTFKATGTASDTLKAGFTYTSAAGANLVNSNSFTDSYDIDATGNAKAQASATLTTTLAFKIYSVAGPSITANGTVGAVVTATANADISSKGSQCSANLTAYLFFSVGGSVALSVSIPGIVNLSHSWNLYSNQWQFPNPAWKKDFALNDAGTCFPVDGGPPSGGNSAAATSSSGSSGSSGTNSSSSGGSGDTQSFGNCGTGNTCSSGQDCCANGDGGKPQCVDGTQNVQNCGYCGADCPTISGDPNSTCNGGSCSCFCPGGTVHEGETCPDGIDTTTCNG